VDTLRSLRNALKLGASLTVTYGLALAARVVLPRYLGPEAFGSYNWADATAATFFVLTTLGLDTYIRKEVSVRREHASEFFGGTLLLQFAMALVLMGGMLLVTRRDGHSPEVQWLALLLGGYQFFFRCNATLAAVLHARERVDGLSIAHVATKCLWGVGLAVVLLLRLPLPWLAVPFVATEALKAGILLQLARHHAGLRLRMDARATWLVVVAALPFFLNDAAIATNGKLDVMILGLLASTREVGYQGAAWNIAGMTMLLSPILGWVVMPLLSRAAAQSPEELSRILRRTLEAIFSFAVPVTLALALGAETWVRLMYGELFAPAAPVLRMQAPIFVLTYLATVMATGLIASNRTWTVTATSVMAMVLNPLLNLLLIPPMLAGLGPAGGAQATALSLATCELLVTGILAFTLGRRAFDGRSAAVLVKTLGVCAAVTGLHVLLGRLALERGVYTEGLPFGLFRLVVDGSAYVLLVFLTRAVRLDEMLGLVRMLRDRRAQKNAHA